MPLHIVVVTDGDGSCLWNARSPSGSFVVLASESGGVAAAAWAARHQTCAPAPTGEAEMVALGETFRRCQRTQTGADAQWALAACQRDVAPGMEYVHKRQRISVATLGSGSRVTDGAIHRVDSHSNLSDLFTQAVQPDRFNVLRHVGGVRLFGEPGEPATIARRLLEEEPRCLQGRCVRCSVWCLSGRCAESHHRQHAHFNPRYGARAPSHRTMPYLAPVPMATEPRDEPKEYSLRPPSFRVYICTYI